MVMWIIINVYVEILFLYVYVDLCIYVLFVLLYVCKFICEFKDIYCFGVSFIILFFYLMFVC